MYTHIYILYVWFYYIYEMNIIMIVSSATARR